MAVMGAFLSHPMPAGWCAIGEIGLGGEVRAIPHFDQRIAQAKRRGYDRILVPITQAPTLEPEALLVSNIGDIAGLLHKNTEINLGKKLLSDGKKPEVSLSR